MSASQELVPFDAAPLDAPSRRVTVLEDRAQVVRRATVAAAVGMTRWRVREVSPVVADRTLNVRVRPGLRVDDARVVRRRRMHDELSSGERAALQDQRRQAGIEIQRAREEAVLIKERLERAQRAVVLLIDGVNRELPYRDRFDPRIAADVEASFARVRGCERELVEHDGALDALVRRAALLELRLKELGGGNERLVTELELRVTVETAGSYELSIEYMVPCAMWRPMHRATLGAMAPAGEGRQEGHGIHLECEAAVWQATGEDWRDVELRFSTARPTQQAEPPLLQDDVLATRRKVERQVRVVTREEHIATTGEGALALSHELPGVDDGGETRLLGASKVMTIPANGRLTRVPVFSVETVGDLDRIARPELSPLVYVRTRQDHRGKQPILAGPVELLRDSGNVGRGSVDFVAPGERFALSWGAEDAIRIRRETKEQRDVSRLTGKQLIVRTVELFVSNLDDREVRFAIEERVPVSQIGAVEVVVDPTETSPKATPDAQGIVRWPMILPPHGTTTLKLVVRLTADASVTGL